MRRIILTERQGKALADHARGCMPNESCALLLGSVDGGDATVSEVVLAENSERSPRRFAIPNGQLIRAYEEAERKGVGVVGIFHSHPDSAAYPSDTDARFMRGNPVVWVIYSGIDGCFRAFVLDGEMAEVEVAGVSTA